MEYFNSEENSMRYGQIKVDKLYYTSGFAMLLCRSKYSAEVKPMEAFTMTDEYYMGLALKEAEAAFLKGEVPIGAVIVREGNVIARAHNLRELSKNATAHAEILAIQRACDFLRGWRLTSSTLYVTIEPCPMCAGAILQSRIERVVIGAMDAKAGACGSIVNLLNNSSFNHQCEIKTGVLEADCRRIMQEFFSQLRKK